MTARSPVAHGLDDPALWTARCSDAALYLVEQFNRWRGGTVMKCEAFYHGPRDVGFLLRPVGGAYRWLTVQLEADGSGLFVSDRGHHPEFRHSLFCRFERADTGALLLHACGEVATTPDAAVAILIGTWLEMFD